MGQSARIATIYRQNEARGRLVFLIIEQKGHRKWSLIKMGDKCVLISTRTCFQQEEARGGMHAVIK